MKALTVIVVAIFLIQAPLNAQDEEAARTQRYRAKVLGKWFVEKFQYDDIYRTRAESGDIIYDFAENGILTYTDSETTWSSEWEMINWGWIRVKHSDGTIELFEVFYLANNRLRLDLKDDEVVVKVYLER